jgi:hypothetical protein
MCELLGCGQIDTPNPNGSKIYCQEQRLDFTLSDLTKVFFFVIRSAIFDILIRSIMVS